jgi:hypothetical protein
MVKANWWRPIPGLALLAVAAALSMSAGTPSDLPGLALGWPLLLHLERGTALVAALGVVALVGVRATMGRFPVRLGQVEYAGRVMSEFDEAARSDGDRLDALEGAVALLRAELENGIADMIGTECLIYLPRTSGPGRSLRVVTRSRPSRMSTSTTERGFRSSVSARRSSRPAAAETWRFSLRRLECARRSTERPGSGDCVAQPLGRVVARRAAQPELLDQAGV